MLLRPLLTSALGCYSDSCSLPHSDSTRNPALVVLSIHLSEVLTRLIAILYSRIPTSLGAPCLSALRVLGTPLGHPCLNSSYKSEPAPSDPIQTSVLGPRSDLRPRTPFDLRPRTPFGPPSSSALPSEPLSSNSAWRSARTSVSRSASRVRARAFGARSDLRHCPRYECHVDPNCS
jgi:hypothetical protein